MQEESKTLTSETTPIAMEVAGLDVPDVITDIAYLRQVSKRTTAAEVAKLKLVLKIQAAVMRANSGGVGMSAIQLGIPIRAAWYRARVDQKGTMREQLLINPRIVKYSDAGVFPSEGCLSLPGKYHSTMRYKTIVYRNDLFPRRTLIATGIEAVVIQHEVDHMNGVLFIDRRATPKGKDGQKIGRNDPCPCGSGKKYKKCCWLKERDW